MAVTFLVSKCVYLNSQRLCMPISRTFSQVTFEAFMTLESYMLISFTTSFLWFPSLIPFHPLHHKSSKSWNVKQIMTSFDLWGPKGERLLFLFRSSTLTYLNWYWTYVRYKLTHYKSLPSKQNRQVIVRTYYYIINGNLNVSSREIGFPCPGMAS